MAYGVPPKSTHTLPPGRRSFAETGPVPKPQIVRPGKYGDGQDVMGTPSGAEHRSTGAGYLSGKAYRRQLGEQASVPQVLQERSLFRARLRRMHRFATHKTMVAVLDLMSAINRAALQ